MFHIHDDSDGFHGARHELDKHRGLPADHRVALAAAHDSLARLAPLCSQHPAKGRATDGDYISKLADIHDRLCALAGNSICPGRANQPGDTGTDSKAAVSAADKLAVLKACLTKANFLGRDAPGAARSSGGDRLKAYLNKCHYEARYARSGHDLYRRR